MTSRLIRPLDRFREGFPNLNFREVYSFTTAGERILVTDPTYLGDVYHSKDQVAAFVRARGVFVMDFGGDTACPVWWSPPIVTMPISIHRSEEDRQSAGDGVVLAEEVGTDSGSFVFLPLTADVPEPLSRIVNDILREHNGAALDLPSGNWSVWYAQFDVPEDKRGNWPESFYRDIVLKWQP